MNNKTDDSLRNTCVLRDVGAPSPTVTFVRYGNELNGKNIPNGKTVKPPEKRFFVFS